MRLVTDGLSGELALWLREPFPKGIFNRGKPPCERL